MEMKCNEKHSLIALGKLIQSERNKRNMSQTKFYRFLFPLSVREDDNIRRIMREIEHGERKTVDYEFLIALHDKCELSMDYLFGYETEYPTHENKHVCEYTGLSAHTVDILHSYALWNNIDIPDATNEMSDEELKARCINLSQKIESKWILNILDLLFTEQKNKKKTMFPNMKILHEMYMMCASVPESVWGAILEEVELAKTGQFLLDRTHEIKMDSLYMEDSFHAINPINIVELHQRMWRERLMNDLDKLADQVRETAAKNMSENTFLINLNQ